MFAMSTYHRGTQRAVGALSHYAQVAHNERAGARFTTPLFGDIISFQGVMNYGPYSALPFCGNNAKIVRAPSVSRSTRLFNRPARSARNLDQRKCIHLQS